MSVDSCEHPEVCQRTISEPYGYPIWICERCGSIWSQKNTENPEDWRPEECVEISQAEPRGQNADDS